MNGFVSWRSYRNFERAIKHESRYFHSLEVQGFLDTVLITSQNRIETIPSSSFLWRAQLGHAWEPFFEGAEHIDDLPAPYPPERMKPLHGRAVEGRANPKGIPHLYLATNKETALAEVRPWIGSYISVAQFKTLTSLKIVNCTTDRNESHFYFEEPPPNEREEAVWGDIDRAFARPVSRSDDTADYVPTQIVAELFKSKGFDGVAFRSSLGSGHNIALFDAKAADLVNCSLFEVKSIRSEFNEVANPYFMKKNTNENNKDSESA